MSCGLFAWCPILPTFLLTLTVPVAAAALLYAQWEYLERGKLSLLGLLLLCAMLFMPSLALEYATECEMPNTAEEPAGYSHVAPKGGGL